MKRWARGILVLPILCTLGVSPSEAATLYSENFETNLAGWVGKSGGGHNGQIVADPSGAANNVLNFVALNSGGDIFRTNTSFSTTGNQYILQFDYYGTNSESGGFIGYSYGLPGNHVWLAGSDTNYGGVSILAGDNSWHHYSYTFTTSGPIHLMLEDFSGSDPVAGNAYFDNILLTDANGVSAVPEPETYAMLLAGLGLLGFTARRRKQNLG